MREDVIEMLNTMSILEKFELSFHLLKEQKYVYEELENFRSRTDQYTQGMLLATENHRLNGLAVKQLETINELSNKCKLE